MKNAQEAFWVESIPEERVAGLEALDTVEGWDLSSPIRD